MQQADRLGALEAEASRRRLAAMLAIRAMLSDEQRAELVRIREEDGPRGRRSPCAADLAEHCPDASPGRGALQCVSQRWEDLSPQCRRFFEHGLGGGRERPPPGGGG